MINTAIQQIEAALPGALGTVKGVRLDTDRAIAVFVLPFTDRHHQPFRFYAYTRPKSKKIFLTDAGGMLETLKKSGLGVEMDLLQETLRTFDLVVLEDGQVLEQTDRPLWQRILALVQGLILADGVLRTWTLPRKTA